MVKQRLPAVLLNQSRVHDAGLTGYTVELACLGCRRVRGFDSDALWWLFEQRGWTTG